MIGSVKLIAAARFVHDGRRLFPGERFEASEREAADLVAIRFASMAREDDAVVGGTEQSQEPVVIARDQEADAPAGGIEIARKKRARRRAKGAKT